MVRWWRWAPVSQDGVAPSRMVSVSASVNLPLHHKVQKFSSGTGSPRWSRKKGRKTVVVVVVYYLLSPSVTFTSKKAARRLISRQNGAKTHLKTVNNLVHFVPVQVEVALNEISINEARNRLGLLISVKRTPADDRSRQRNKTPSLTICTTIRAVKTGA